jgi:DNA polymerase-3 subunit alpha
LRKFCSIRSQKTKKLKMSLEELEKWEKKEENKQGETSNNSEKIQAVWVIIDIRKVMTKTGNQMMFLKCEWFDYDFEVVIFPKSFDIYKNKLAVSKIVIVNWFLDINFEYRRKSIRAQNIQDYTISWVRETAKNLGLFDNSKRLVNLNVSSFSSEASFVPVLEESWEKDEESFEEDLE